MEQNSYWSIGVLVVFVISIISFSSFENPTPTGFDVAQQDQNTNQLFKKLADNAKKEQETYSLLAQNLNQMAKNSAEKQQILATLSQQKVTSQQPESNPATNNCVESDSGKDFYVKGTKNSDNDKTYPDDECANIEYGSTKAILEYYCENGKIKKEYGQCPTSCKEGACQGPKPTPGCIDDDPDDDPSKQGQISLITKDYVDGGGTYSDVCVDDTLKKPSDTRLQQVSCNKDKEAYLSAKYPLDKAKVFTPMDCPSDQKCFKGACVPK